ncbi:hypothetical protein [Limosilactobacillus fermentum]
MMLLFGTFLITYNSLKSCHFKK